MKRSLLISIATLALALATLCTACPRANAQWPIYVVAGSYSYLFNFLQNDIEETISFDINNEGEFQAFPVYIIGSDYLGTYPNGTYDAGFQTTYSPTQLQPFMNDQSFSVTYPWSYGVLQAGSHYQIIEVQDPAQVHIPYGSDPGPMTYVMSYTL